ncbi:MAG: 4-hydroxythreonine-4-phosphate dehydrogenase [Firmicutes bacterium]|nr:4-hydroxythreonine-4-phosphate dehydrogenase [Bacillota bacterium]MDI6705514.1 4-hydroxythreonine-4-phosphate dehydrogenase PdxA [Bacillota bacterium]
MGDPAGIGSEIILKSFLKEEVKPLRLIVIGSFEVMKTMMEQIKISGIRLNSVSSVQEAVFDDSTLNIVDIPNVDVDKLKPGKVQAMAGNAAFEYLRKGIALALNGEIDAIATAPLNKEAMHLAGHMYPGHTEILAKFTNTRDYAMLLYDERLKVIHVTTHMSLKQAIDTLHRERIEAVIQIAHDTLRKIGYQNPRVAVAGLNPHAGEGGLFGREEIDIIGPAVENMVRKGLNVTGPVPPDTVFLKALQGTFDIVVAMYHDQGHIPLKLLGFHTGINVTAGLPIIRTSVDHGTAFGKAWKGTANESSMVQAILLAGKLASSK